MANCFVRSVSVAVAVVFAAALSAGCSSSGGDQPKSRSADGTASVDGSGPAAPDPGSAPQDLDPSSLCSELIAATDEERAETIDAAFLSLEDFAAQQSEVVEQCEQWPGLAVLDAAERANAGVEAGSLPLRTGSPCWTFVEATVISQDFVIQEVRDMAAWGSVSDPADVAEQCEQWPEMTVYEAVRRVMHGYEPSEPRGTPFPMLEHDDPPPEFDGELYDE